MPLSLKLRLAYDVDVIKLVKKQMQVGITARVFLEDSEIADVAFSFLTHALEKQRQSFSHGFTAPSEYVLGILRVEVSPAGRLFATGDIEKVALTVRPERESAHPGTRRPCDFVMCARRPKAAAIFETWAAATATAVDIEKQRRVSQGPGIAVYLGHHRDASGRKLPPLYADMYGGLATPSGIEPEARSAGALKSGDITPEVSLVPEKLANGPHLVRQGADNADTGGGSHTTPIGALTGRVKG